MLALHGVGGVVCLPILDDLISGHHVACRFFVYAFGGEESVASIMRWNGMSWMKEVGVTYGCLKSRAQNVNHVAIQCIKAEASG